MTMKTFWYAVQNISKTVLSQAGSKNWHAYLIISLPFYHGCLALREDMFDQERRLQSTCSRYNSIFNRNIQEIYLAETLPLVHFNKQSNLCPWYSLKDHLWYFHAYLYNTLCKIVISSHLSINRQKEEVCLNVVFHKLVPHNTVYKC